MRYTDALSRLFDFIEGPEDDTFTMPIEDVREELRELGIDTAPIKALLLREIARLLAERGSRDGDHG